MTKPGELTARWSKRESDLLLAWGGDGATSSDGALLSDALSGKRLAPSLKNYPGYDVLPSLIDELKARGYDVETLRFSIRRKAKAEPPPT
jgi:hypothetical protein